MAKSKAAKRKRITQTEHPNKNLKILSTISCPPDKSSSSEPKNLQTIISDEELRTTIETLQILSEYPSIIKSKSCKKLRVAVYDFRQACTTGVNTAADTNLTSRITAAITDGKYTDALILLVEMRIRREPPKLGALCRWVRDLDVVSGLSAKVDGISHTLQRSEEDKERLRVLDAVLRVAGPTDVYPEGSTLSSDPIALQELWNLREDARPLNQVYQSVLDGTVFESCPKGLKDQFRIVETTPGPDRKPPNLHQAVLYASRDDAIILSPTTPKTTRHDHPFVPNLSLIKNVLSPSECTTIIAAAQIIGFTPDAPITSSDQDYSVLAHNFYWIADQAFCKRLWERVGPYVPDEVDGKKVRGLNRRFRVYRYVPGAEYRCHIDGAWPPSGIDQTSGAYIYDSSPPTSKQSSLFTFLIYLNDEFEAGETTFFMPSVRDGVMNGYPIKPVMGAVAVFPHGEGKGALLHEGTGVRKGAKYIIRTDVLYDVDATKN